MTCCRPSNIPEVPCQRQAEFFVVGPSGMGNALCRRHKNALFKLWTSDQGFTIGTIFTLKGRAPKSGRQPVPVAYPEGTTL